MTPTEWVRLQGFKDYAFVKNGKDRFSFPPKVSETQQYKQLGNSVSIPIIGELAKYIYRHLEEFKVYGLRESGQNSMLFSTYSKSLIFCYTKFFKNPLISLNL